MNNNSNNPKKLILVSWCMIVMICALAMIPGIGLLTWFIACPFLLITFILGILILNKGAIGHGICVLLMIMIGAPFFIFCTSIVSAALGIGVLAANKEIADKAGNATAAVTSATPIAAEATGIRITASKLLDEYSKNAIAAEQKFKGKALIITGVVDSFGVEMLGRPYVMLKTSSLGAAIQCVFKKSEKDILAKMPKGESMTLKGFVQANLTHDGIGMILIDDCRVVER